MGRFGDNTERFGGPVAQLMLAVRGGLIGDMLGGDVDSSLFLRESEFTSPGADLGGGRSTSSAEDLGERGVIRTEKRCERSQRVPRVLSAACGEFLLQLFSKHVPDGNGKAWRSATKSGGRVGQQLAPVSQSSLAGKERSFVGITLSGVRSSV